MPLPSELLETTGATLLIDSLRYPGLPLSRYFVHKWIDRYDATQSDSNIGKVIVLLFETRDFLALLGEDSRKPGLLGIVDCVSNPSGWEIDEQSDEQHQESKVVFCNDYAQTRSIVQAVKKLIDSEPQPIAAISIAIDSLVPFIIKNGIDAATDLVNRIIQIKTTRSTTEGHQTTTQPIRRIVATIHEDVIFDPVSLDRFAYISSVVMRTGPPALELLSSGEVVSSSKADGELQILQKRESSKVIRLSEEYSLDRKTEMMTFLPRSNRRRATGRRSTSSTTSPSATSEIASLKSVTTTFNLGITEEQKKAKEGVQLPYVHKNKTTNAPSGGGGVIYLDPDDIEYESDDPDDDLDI